MKKLQSSNISHSINEFQKDRPFTKLWVTNKTLTVLVDWVGGHSLNIV